MLANRNTKFFAGLLIVAVALVSVSFAFRPTKGTAIGNQSHAALSKSDTYLPMPPGKQTQLMNAARGSGDFYQRHSSWKWSASASPVDYLDNIQRQQVLVNLDALAQGASDYAQRHPELSAKAASSSNLDDYYFRYLNR